MGEARLELAKWGSEFVLFQFCDLYILIRRALLVRISLSDSIPVAMRLSSLAVPYELLFALALGCEEF